MINNIALINIFEKPIKNSKISSQMLYGEKFKIINKKGNWLKIKTDYDKYTGYIQNKKFLVKFDPQFKISTVKSKIFIKKNKQIRKTNRFLYFGSRITKISENKKFIEFDKNKWIKRKDLNHFVRYHSDRGHIPIDNFKKEIRIISYAGKRLTRTQIDDLFKHAAVWQKLLLKEKSVRGTYTSDSTNLAHVRGHGFTARNQPSTSPSYSQKVQHLQTRKGLSV